MKPLRIAIVAIAFLSFFFSPISHASSEIRIAEYDFYPVGYVDDGVAKGILPDYTAKLQKLLPEDVVIKNYIVNLARGLHSMLDATSCDMYFGAPVATHKDKMEDLGVIYSLRYLALPKKGIAVNNKNDLLQYKLGVLRIGGGGKLWHFFICLQRLWSQ